ncbi:primosomal protein N' [Rhodobium gokarnense]|uniref:Replication restart protein PriA n=1 Tax=Rhodobium gokarnense TaxID=364296 RepID=A0ABT3HEE0_9HYPH|nr:primosomal protein N' (replication factor Y) [Rhodobium gokarnense]
MANQTASLPGLEPAPEEPAATVPVLVPVAVETAYSYRVPAGMHLGPGTVVQIPLGNRQVVGAVWEPGIWEGGGAKPVDPSKLREILHVFDVPSIDERMRRFIDWVARWTMAPPGMVLRMVLRVPEALEPEPPLKGVRLAGAPPERMTKARARVLDLFEENPSWSKTGLATAAGVSPGVVDGLIGAGTLQIVPLPAAPPAPMPEADWNRRDLSPAQDKAAEEITATVAERRFSVTLLDGVTGAGKTEVYFEAVAEALRRGRQALVLLPEIALTSEFLQRFEERFGCRPGEWHSDVPPKQRVRLWRGVIDGSVRVVVGARSALFLPFPELGLIVVDEEHDPAYKQDDRVAYHARDMAVVRGHIAGFPVILSSATPSIETRHNADTGRYRRIELPDRASGAALPDIHAIDMRRGGPARGRWLAPALTRAVGEALARGDQALLFLNRRGYAPLTLCRSCGHRFECPDCSAWLVEHRFRSVLTCHHCGFSMPTPEACPSCGDVDSLTACGPGVERIAEEAAADFPDARIIVLSSDMPGGTRRLRAELKAIAGGEGDIIIGTQLVAKGHNFPKLKVVGVVDADLGLSTADPRAAERTFQLISQVTGRAGRRDGAGVGYLQTYMPDHPVMRALVSGDRESFYATELEARERSAMPPFARLASLLVTGPDRPLTEGFARELARAAPHQDGVHVLGPADPPLAVIRGRHRQRLLVHADRSADIQAYLHRWLAAGPVPKKGVRLAIDIEPLSFM